MIEREGYTDLSVWTVNRVSQARQRYTTKVSNRMVAVCWRFVEDIVGTRAMHRI